MKNKIIEGLVEWTTYLSILVTVFAVPFLAFGDLTFVDFTKLILCEGAIILGFVLIGVLNDCWEY